MQNGIQLQNVRSNTQNIKYFFSKITQQLLWRPSHQQFCIDLTCKWWNKRITAFEVVGLFNSEQLHSLISLHAVNKPNMTLLETSNPRKNIITMSNPLTFFYLGSYVKQGTFYYETRIDY